MDALNFCFWPTAGLEYDYLAVSLRKVLEADEKAFDAPRLAAMTEVRRQPPPRGRDCRFNMMTSCGVFVAAL